MKYAVSKTTWQVSPGVIRPKLRRLTSDNNYNTPSWKIMYILYSHVIEIFIFHARKLTLSSIFSYLSLVTTIFVHWQLVTPNFLSILLYNFSNENFLFFLCIITYTLELTDWRKKKSFISCRSGRNLSNLWWTFRILKLLFLSIHFD